MAAAHKGNTDMVDAPRPPMPSNRPPVPDVPSRSPGDVAPIGAAPPPPPIDPATGVSKVGPNPWDRRPIVEVASKVDHEKLMRLLILTEKLHDHGTAMAPLKASVDRQINEMKRAAEIEEVEYAKKVKAEDDRVAAELAKRDQAERVRLEALANKEVQDRLHAEALGRVKAQQSPPIDPGAPVFPIGSVTQQTDTRSNYERDFPRDNP